MSGRWIRCASAALVVLSVSVARGDTVEEFIARHWKKPLAPQGPPPPGFSALEASLRPDACGTCHPSQFADWQTSRHARAMDPGVTGQLVEMLEGDPQSALDCQSCHAPLAEQKPLLPADGRFTPNPAYDPLLRAKGIACAACHVRQHQRFGPPRRDGSVATSGPSDRLPHGGVTRSAAFLSAEFCRGCHQFDADGFTLNGKLLENTYAEWKASRFAREGVQCQDCHMPDRRHRWRGIHDPDMVRSGLTITLEQIRDAPAGTVAARLRVASTRVGHAFPTYVTPRVVLRAELVGPGGRVLTGSRRERTIERLVELDLSREVKDTRLLPGQSAALEYRQRAGAEAARARFSVVVYPDAFYTRFFETLLAQGAGRGAAEIQRALDESRRSAFTVFAREIPLR